MAYIMTHRWSPDGIVITFVDEASEGDIVTIRVTAGTKTLLIIGEIEEEGKRLAANGIHVSSCGVGPNRSRHRQP